MLKTYAKDRENLIKYKENINMIEMEIMENPYKAGERFKQKDYLGLRHAKLREGYRVLYAICEEIQNNDKKKFHMARKYADLKYHPCRFCNLPCIEQPEKSIVFIRILCHDEQDRLMKYLNR